MRNSNYFKIILFYLFIVFTNFINAQEYSRTFDVTDFGAVNDGKTINTIAIQNAIDEISKSGGGKLVFTEGKFLTGSIILRSNIHLFLEENAIILGSTNPYHYNKIEKDKDMAKGARDDLSELALILAYKADNITISGQGTIDGQGRKLALNIDSLHHTGVKVDSKYNNRRQRPHETARPKLTRISMCNEVLIKNVTMKNSACWGLSFELCENLTLDSLTVINRAYWNNDGMDITDCRNVRVTNCDVNSADDGICLKSYYPGFSNDSVYIANCIVRSSASAIKFGTASFGGFKNVTIDNIKVYDTFRSAIAIESVDGGVIENINVKNIVAKNTGNAIFIRLGHRAGEKPGVIKDVHISDMKVEIPFAAPDVEYDMRGPAVDFFHNPFPASITGIPGYNVENVKIENIDIEYPGGASKGYAYLPLWRLDNVPEQIKDYPEFHMFRELPSWAFYVRHVRGLTFKNITLKLSKKDFRPAFVFDDVANLKMKKIKLPDEKLSEEIILKSVENYEFDSSNKKLIKIIEDD